MAGDWIKLEHTTPDKPEVIRMASELKLDQDAIVGKLARVWIWADQNSIDGNAITVTEAFLNRLTDCKGFARAMRNVGWLTGEEGALTFPTFDRHNGETAKSRAATNRRVAKHRTRNGASVTDVTEPALQKPLPEKRREESTSTTTPTTPREPAPQPGPSTSQPLNRSCTLEEAFAYADRFNASSSLAGFQIPRPVVTLWHDGRGSIGWVQVRDGVEIPIADWQADLRKFAQHYHRNETSAAPRTGRAIAEPRPGAHPKAHREPDTVHTAASLPRL